MFNFKIYATRHGSAENGGRIRQRDDAMQEMKETLKQAKHKKKGHHI
jgi:hypothetical protein